jgi:hypothetical protein
MNMKLKKILVGILILMIILSIGASSLFTSFTPQSTQAPSGFYGPSGEPYTNGPTAAPGISR